MIFWNINELKRKINNNELTEFNYFIYFIINCMTHLYLAYPGRQFVMAIPNLILNGLILPTACYSFHRFFQNTHFVEKYFALGLVCMIRIMVYTIFFFVALALLQYPIIFFMQFLFPDQAVFLYKSMKYFMAQLLIPMSTPNISGEVFCMLLVFWYATKHYYDLCKQKALLIDKQ
jgi:hypothetical protein